MPKSLYLIDGHAQIYRAYFAPFRDLTSPAGEPTRATHVFFQMLLNLVRDKRPDYLAVALDADESKLLRKAIYPDYKAHRDPTPEDLIPQERRIVATLGAAAIPTLQVVGWEADDIMATLARRLASADLHIYLVSRDKDLDQLLGPHVSLYDPFKDEVVTPDRLFETKGWRPEQAIEAQTLIGDTVDNVPGVRGIGEKTAAKLLEKYGSAQGVVEHADELTPKQRENVLAFAPQMDITRRLVTLRTDAPIEFDLAAAELERIAWPRLREAFEALGFRRLPEAIPDFRARSASEGQTDAGTRVGHGGGGAADETRVDTGVPAARASGSESRSLTLRGSESRSLTLRGSDSAALREPVGTTHVLINTPEALERFARELAAQPEFAVDTETTGISPIDSELVGLSFAWEVGRGYYIPVRCAFGGHLPLDHVREKLGPILADASRRKVGQNIKYDLIVLVNAGLPVAGPLFDTMIAAFALEPAGGSFGVDALCLRHFGFTKIKTNELIGTGRQQITMDQVPLDTIAAYAAEDADYTWRLRQRFEPQLAPAGVDRLFFELEMPLAAVLTEMEMHGVRIDVDFLASLSRTMTKRVGEIEREVCKLAGRSFNLDSPKQLSEVLFDELKFRVVRKTKTTRSTDAETLETLRDETGHAIFPLLLEYREMQKLRGTYVDALPLARSRRTGRIHTSYHQTGAVTGRLSSSEPNLQNIPIRTEAGREIRRAFVPRTPDDVLIAADYSQIELRLLAHFSEDDALSSAFAADQDIHAFVASQVHGVPLDQVTKELRASAKAVNFGIIYGQTAFGLAAGTGMSRTDAQAFIDAYFKRYPRIRAYMDHVIADARRNGGVRTIYGRWRPIDGITSQNAAVRNQAERFAVNTVIQGSAADLIKLAMVRLHARVKREKLPLRMLLQVHDELVCEGPRAAAERLGAIIREEMTSAMRLRVPLKVDVGCGDNWLDAK